MKNPILMKIIGGIYKGRRLATPPSKGVRPSSERLRETLFNICQLEIEGSRFLELCAGTGAIGFEALSRGAAHITMVEQNKSAIACIQKNRKTLEIGPEVTLLQSDVRSALDRLNGPFDLIFIDPPYGALALDEILDRASLLLQTGGTLFLEESHKLEEIPPTLDLVKQRRIGPANLYQFKCKELYPQSD